MTPEQLEALSDIRSFEASLFAVAVELRTVLVAVRQHEDPFRKQATPIPRQVSDTEQGPVSKELLEVVRNRAKENVLKKPRYSSILSRHYRALKAFNQLHARHDYIFNGIAGHELSPQQRQVKEQASRIFRTILLGEYLYE